MNLDETFSLAPVERARAQHTSSDAIEFVFGDADVRLCTTDRALAGIRAHARQSPTEEVGGILLGRQFSHNGRMLVVVSDHVALPSDSTSVVHFDFDQSAILALFRHLEHSTDGSYVVGWYHSHMRGDPFMSEFDRRVHMNHFPQPWYVSCVVVVGEWSMPAGFWRLVDGDLVRIEEHLIHMTPSLPESSAEQHRQFVRACSVQETPLDDSIRNALPVLFDLGLPPQSRLAEALGGIVGPDGNRSEESVGVTSLQVVLELAGALAANPAVAVEVEQVREQLRVVHFQDDMFSARLISALIQDKVAVGAGRCYSMTPGELLIYGFELDQAVYWPVRLDGSAGLVDLTFSRDGTLWLLTEDRKVVRVSQSSLKEKDEEVSVKFRYNVLSVVDLNSDPEQVVGGDGTIWIRTADQVIRFAVVENKEDSTSLATGVGFSTPLSGCLLAETGGRRRIKDDGMLVSFHDGTLATWERDGDGFKRTGQRALPAHWARWRLTHACLTEVGLYALFDDGEAGQLALLKRGSLEVACHYVHNESGDDRIPISSICVDKLGRVYAKKGVTLFRVRP